MEDPPAPKRQRRSAEGQGLSKKRARAPNNPVPSAKRSRKSANLLAEELLGSKKPVTDQSILRVLRAWRFTENTNRINVTPIDEAFVYSDTLGLVSSRTGVVSASRQTKLYPAVFRLMAAWVAGAWPLLPFPFTSISVNFNYAARIHRDALNVGPSLTRAFGEYRGGALKYWGDDDGCLSLDELRKLPATVLATGDALCLFDGRRAHQADAVSIFEFGGMKVS